MKWHESTLEIDGMPEHESAVISGILKDGQLSIEVRYVCPDVEQKIIEWSKPIKMWVSQEPTNEEIEEKYWEKLEKIRHRHESRKYTEWVPYFITKFNDQ